MNKGIVILVLLAALALACNLPASTAAPTQGQVQPTPLAEATEAEPVPAPTEARPAPTEPLPSPAPLETTATPPPTPTPVNGIPFTYENVSLVIPLGLAGGATGATIPETTSFDTAPWELTPGNIEILLDGYLLQNKFHKPKIYVYPAADYAAIDPGAAENLLGLQGILADPAALPSTQDLPHVPFFNAAQVFASQIRVISFQNGSGVRSLTQYAQYFAQVNNHELFYHFEGLTSDNLYYLIAVLPITAPSLPATSDPGESVPAGGVLYPDESDIYTDFDHYYALLTEDLDTTAPEAFGPTLLVLDELIQSIIVTP